MGIKELKWEICSSKIVWFRIHGIQFVAFQCFLVTCSVLVYRAFPGKGYDSHRQKRGIVLTNHHTRGFVFFFSHFIHFSLVSLAKFTFPRWLISALPQKCIDTAVVSWSVKLTTEWRYMAHVKELLQSTSRLAEEKYHKTNKLHWGLKPLIFYTISSWTRALCIKLMRGKSQISQFWWSFHCVWAHSDCRCNYFSVPGSFNL